MTLISSDIQLGYRTRTLMIFGFEKYGTGYLQTGCQSPSLLNNYVVTLETTIMQMNKMYVPNTLNKIQCVTLTSRDEI